MPTVVQMISQFLLDVAMRQWIMLAQLVEAASCFVFEDKNKNITTLENETSVLSRNFGQQSSNDASSHSTRTEAWKQSIL
jgi:hypothetical protein